MPGQDYLVPLLLALLFVAAILAAVLFRRRRRRSRRPTRLDIGATKPLFPKERMAENGASDGT
ncbi:MAG: hypothetical protein ACFBQW_07600 [Sphingomonadaceae bacterium]